VRNRLTALTEADPWLGIKTLADVGTKFDIKAEVLRNGVLVGSGQLNSTAFGSNSATFSTSKAIQKVITLAGIGLPVNLISGDTLSLRLSVRIAATGTTHTNATATLWFNIPTTTATPEGNSHLHGKINNGPEFAYYLAGLAANPTTFALKASNAGVGPTQSIDVFVDKNVGGNPFKEFGTWTMVIAP
jgi:hypothetical protein